MTNKERANRLKQRIKKQHGTISRFALHLGVADYFLRKSLARLARNENKYVTSFNPINEFERWEELLKLSKQTKLK